MYEISVSAVIQRINRQLRKHDRILRKTRGRRQLHQFGRYWIHDWRRNRIIDTRVDPERFARDLGVLAPHESVSE